MEYMESGMPLKCPGSIFVAIRAVVIGECLLLTIPYFDDQLQGRFRRIVAFIVSIRVIIKITAGFTANAHVQELQCDNADQELFKYIQCLLIHYDAVKLFKILPLLPGIF